MYNRLKTQWAVIILQSTNVAYTPLELTMKTKRELLGITNN